MMMTSNHSQPGIKHFGEIKLDYPSPIHLSNGIPVWVIGNGEDEINRLAIYMGGGVYQESIPMQAFLTALMSTEGHEKMTASEMAEALDYYGSWKSSQSHDQYTSITLFSLNRNFENTLKIVFDSITSPSFPDHEFNLYKKRIASNIETARKRVKYLANEKIKQLYYGENHPLARPATPEAILSIDKEMLQSFHGKHFHSNNCQLIIAGKISDSELALLESSFGQWSNPGEKFREAAVEINPAREMFTMVDQPGAVQSAIAITIKAIPRRHPDYFKLRLAITALGGYFGSRLNANIREEKGYTYGISSMLAGRKDDSHISISTECATRYTWLIIEEIKKEIKTLQQELMPMQELDIVKQYMLSDQVKIFDTPFNLASHISNSFLYGIYSEYFNNQIASIHATTPQDVMDMARKYLHEDHMRIVIAGDTKSLKKYK